MVVMMMGAVVLALIEKRREGVPWVSVFVQSIGVDDVVALVKPIGNDGVLFDWREDEGGWGRGGGEERTRGGEGRRGGCGRWRGEGEREGRGRGRADGGYGIWNGWDGRYVIGMGGMGGMGGIVRYVVCQI